MTNIMNSRVKICLYKSNYLNGRVNIGFRITFSDWRRERSLFELSKKGLKNCKVLKNQLFRPF